MLIPTAIRRVLFSLAAASAVCAASAGTLIVQSPNDGDFVGQNTIITFRITGGVNQVTVRAVITADEGGASTTLQTQVNPDENGNANGTLNWNPSESFPEGGYTIVVTATEAGNKYNEVTIHVILDRLAPRLFEYSPLNNSFINGPINITARIDEPPKNILEWRVTVNDADLPNNTGQSQDVSVLWDPANIEQDGVQTVKIKVKDRAQNESTQEITVTVDRAAPVLDAVYPRNNQAIRPGSIVTFLVLVHDITSDSVDPVAVILEIRDLNDNVLRRVSRLRYDDVDETTARWVGRWRANLPPGNDHFKLTIRAVDRAGNVAAPQEVPLHFGF
ncbi:MAG TPA: hypothetical protein VFG65_05105 [Fimbriimonadales bacterium]|jgi:hypothetical protein|nr:hypothetical protein [Fimbriimonadales bacterium]